MISSHFSSSVMKEAGDDCPEENIMEIDLSIVKEEVLSVDDLEDYSWAESNDNDPVTIKTEEDEIDPDFGDEDPSLVGTSSKTKMRKLAMAKVTTRIGKGATKKHWCSICKCKQESRYALALHRIKVHLDQAQYRCSQCPRVFFHHSNHRKHELSHLGPPPRSQCTMCTKTFARKDGLKAHIRTVHTGERPYVCQDCGMTFARDFCYRTHVLMHTGTRPYACDECPKAFYCKSDLVRHKRLHTGEKPYRCDRCPKVFRTRGLLNQHMGFHTGEKPLACGLCPKMFRLGTNVSLHRGCHIANATMVKSHKCKVCNKEFSRRGNMTEHMKRHATVKAIQCHYCSLTFKTNGDRVRHENSHTRMKVFICDTCGKSLLRKGNLRNHIIRHHLKPTWPKRPTVCLACGRDYQFPSRLKIHQKNKKCSEYLKNLKKNKKPT